MRLKIWIVCFVFTCILVEARFVEDWSHTKLIEASDVVVLVRVLTPTKILEKVNEKPVEYDSTITIFEVKGLLKGKLNTDKITFTHYEYSKDGKVIIDGFMFAHFRKSDTNTYLAFLKKGEDGNYLPVTGLDSALSFQKIVEDSPPTFFEWTKK
jgi:hypothetical protein